MRRYDGNSGRYIHIPEEHPRKESDYRKDEEAQSQQIEVRKEATAKPPPNQFGSGLQKIISNIFTQGFETEDLLLFAVLFLMYQETKDKELLVIMGGMFLL